MQERYVVVEVLDRILQFPARAHRLCFETARRGHGHLQVRVLRVDGGLLLGDRDLIRLLVQLGDEVAFAHTVIVIHQNPGDLACDAGSHERHVAIHISVIRRNGGQSPVDIRNAEGEHGRQHKRTEHADEQAPSPRRSVDWRRQGCAFYRSGFAR
jgi:hypothetical protein